MERLREREREPKRWTTTTTRDSGQNSLRVVWDTGVIIITKPLFFPFLLFLFLFIFIFLFLTFEVCARARSRSKVRRHHLDGRRLFPYQTSSNNRRRIGSRNRKKIKIKFLIHQRLAPLLNVLLVQLGKRKTAALISVYWVQLFVFLL